jgi:acetyl esterase/lipase
MSRENIERMRRKGSDLRIFERICMGMMPVLVSLSRVRSLAAASALMLSFGFVSAVAAAQAPPAPASPIPPGVPLYKGAAPGALGHTAADTPVMYPFIPADSSGQPRAAVLVLPGGGYTHIALGHEGFQIAEWLNAQGIAAFVLDYRVAPYRYPVEIEDGEAAMRMVRAQAADDHIDPDRIGVWGSSAGGSLAAVLATECNVADAPNSTLAKVGCQPNFAVLAYPVVSMELPLAHVGSRVALLGRPPDPELARKLSPQYAVTAATPPTFIFATTGDPVVPVGNSQAMYAALQAKGVPAEMHLFNYADHGCGLCGNIPYLSVWPTLLRSWLIRVGALPANAPPAPPPGPNMADWPAGLDGPGH